jgi:hypothetical protein
MTVAVKSYTILLMSKTVKLFTTDIQKNVAEFQFGNDGPSNTATTGAEQLHKHGCYLTE